MITRPANAAIPRPPKISPMCPSTVKVGFGSLPAEMRISNTPMAQSTMTATERTVRKDTNRLLIGCPNVQDHTEPLARLTIETSSEKDLQKAVIEPKPKDVKIQKGVEPKVKDVKVDKAPEKSK